MKNVIYNPVRNVEAMKADSNTQSIAPILDEFTSGNVINDFKVFAKEIESRLNVSVRFANDDSAFRVGEGMVQFINAALDSTTLNQLDESRWRIKGGPLNAWVLCV